ncbi:membrane protein [Saccharopolyspora subtropica]|uniref:Membrane protein n=1 Tax=Saccharopolyspora thermophila TaxID=89367 RepID=A0A917NBW8_9PSEU|nr:GlsB/YeaQ/YmgE family stress response membrane protein [Saccharopolyspora subtropica]GGI87460.1 membrane protein [Saccharopolyspora subtropica]
MGILSWILFGLIAGVIAKFILPGKDPGGIILTILIGIAGGLLGGWVSTALAGGEGVTGFNLMSFVWAVVGSLILLAIYRVIFHRKRGLRV